MTSFTPQQRAAIERREGDLLLDASAGSGKTSVLVERFVRAVIEDGAQVGGILTITFTEKAAAELRERIRQRLRELGADDAARATEGAFISTIHAFCARMLRTHALAAGLDPQFTVLDETETAALAELAFDRALEDLAQNAAGAVELIAAYGTASLRGAIIGAYRELRARGELVPRLPPLGPRPDLDTLRDELEQAAAAAARELGAIDSPAAKVRQGLERLESCGDVLALADPWPGELERLSLPGGNGAALSTPVCQAYAEALGRYRSACSYRRAERTRELMDALLRGFGAAYAQRKRGVSGLDFEDLELLARELLATDSELRERYRGRFSSVMVDELQDTNVVQLELIEAIADGNVFAVGDAQQSIYGFRHADVELFERLGERLAASGARQTLDVNFRSRAEIVAALNSAFELALGERFRPLRAGREDPPAGEPLVELVLADKGADYSADGLGAPWRLAEAAGLARRVQELVQAGTSYRDIVVLTRASTDLRVYERALEDAAIPTYVIGGRGYWAHPQVVDLVAYLRALANPRDEEALITVLVSPLVGLCLDGLVSLISAARASGRDPWWLLREPQGRLEGLPADAREKLARFTPWFADERAAAVRIGVPELLARALERTGYDLMMLSLPGGQRRLANVRKLMRLGAEHEAAAGIDLRGFLELVRARSSGFGGSREQRESEAPVEGEALDAVRLMTIHRAKGLEFETVCVADLGRGPIRRAEVIRLARGRLGLRLAEPGTGKREPALDYEALGEEQREREQQEERRLFYVAMTRARERLILSGAARFDAWPSNGGGGPIAWIAPAFVPDIAERVKQGGSVTDTGVRLITVDPDAPPAASAPDDGRFLSPGERFRPSASALAAVPAPIPGPIPAPIPAPAPAPAVSRLSYSALGEYQRCGYRFYAERVLRLPAIAVAGASGADGGKGAGLSGTERGILVHAVLERLDFRRPVPVSVSAVVAPGERSPSAAEAAELDALIADFAASALCARLASATHVRREERFSFLLGGVLMTGAFDVLAREAAGSMLVVDYKSDRLDGADAATLVDSMYSTQRLVYALAALRAGAREVEVAHVFLEAPDAPALARFAAEDDARLAHELEGLAGGVLRREFPVTAAPRRAICSGCPAEGGLCSWPLEMTRRETADTLF